MFEPRKGDKTYYLPYVDSYLNYFCLATPTAQITKEEFEDAVGDRSSIRRNVHRWFFKLPLKKSASLYSRLMDVRIKELSQEQWKNHIYLIYSWLCEDEYDLIKDVMAPYLLIDNYHWDDEEDVEIAKRYATAKLDKILRSSKVNRMNVARNLCALLFFCPGGLAISNRDSARSRRLWRCTAAHRRQTAARVW